jgi:hypothetical protein
LASCFFAPSALHFVKFESFLTAAANGRAFLFLVLPDTGGILPALGGGLTNVEGLLMEDSDDCGPLTGFFAVDSKSLLRAFLVIRVDSR